MKPRHIALMMIAAAALSACANADFVTRAAPFETGLLTSSTGRPDLAPLVAPYAVTDVELVSARSDDTAPAGLPRNVTVTGVEVIVPETLTVSEANSYKPRADIVWREDPLGDRRAQIDALITAAIEQGVKGMQGDTEVRLEFVVSRFHALTEKTRYSLPFGFRATHDVQLTLTVYDAKTGVVLVPEHEVGFEIDAHTNGLALADEARGITQRSRISAALIQMIRAELTAS